MVFQHPHPFDPTYGYDLARLKAITPPSAPADYEAFWRQTYAQTLATPPRPVVRPIESANPEVEVYEIDYDGLGGFRVGGWLTRPRRQKPVRGLVVGHGYGGRGGPELDVPGPSAVCIFPCGRGFNRSARPELPASSPQHVLHGIESRETYLHRFCVADLWSAVSALVEVAPEVAGHVDYMGSSFGGGMGAMALPWEPRFRRASLGVPSFGNHPLRVTCQCVGSGEAVRKLYLQRPEILNTLAYFDSAVAATFCHIPVLAACALFDPAVPPPGQFSVYNALAGEKDLFVLQAGHHDWPGGQQDEKNRWARQCEWFAQKPSKAAGHHSGKCLAASR